MPDYLTLAELAQHLRISKLTLYRWVKAGKIPAHRYGRKWLFDKEEIKKGEKKMMVNLTFVVCSKCGRTQEFLQARKGGWLIKANVVRCPDHITKYAIKQSRDGWQKKSKED